MSRLKENQYNKPVGKLGNRVFYFVGEDYRSRAYVIPVQPGTAMQRTWWTKFRRAVRKWNTLQPWAKEEWNAKAVNYQMSGFNKFVSDWMAN